MKWNALGLDEELKSLGLRSPALGEHEFDSESHIGTRGTELGAIDRRILRGAPTLVNTQPRATGGDPRDGVSHGFSIQTLLGRPVARGRRRTFPAVGDNDGPFGRCLELIREINVCNPQRECRRIRRLVVAETDHRQPLIGKTNQLSTVADEGAAVMDFAQATIVAYGQARGVLERLAPAGGNVVIGQVVHIHLDDELVNDRLHIDYSKLRAIGRLGGPGYATTRERFAMPRGRAALAARDDARDDGHEEIR